MKNGSRIAHVLALVALEQSDVPDIGAGPQSYANFGRQNIRTTQTEVITVSGHRVHADGLVAYASESINTEFLRVHADQRIRKAFRRQAHRPIAVLEPALKIAREHFIAHAH